MLEQLLTNQMLKLFLFPMKFTKVVIAQKILIYERNLNLVYIQDLELSDLNHLI